MSTAQIALLGAIAGLTIFLGLPVGRIRNPAPRLRAFLNALSIGVLVFLLWDVLSHAFAPVEDALVAVTSDHDGSWATFVGLAFVAIAGLTVGLMSLTYYDGWLSRRAGVPVGAEVSMLWLDTPARRLAFLIAVGIGLHNFSEGLAIGQSAASGEVSLALLLIVGFGLHNATEGFGIVAPLAGDERTPSWGFLGVLGLIGGGPTFVGTLIGQVYVNEYLFVAFLALAAGSILYVVMQLLKVGFKLGHREFMMWGILLGLLAGLATDLVIVAAGA
ncbi:MAG: ZIP family metal transporter [Actinomycetes bacterium]